MRWALIPGPPLPGHWGPAAAPGGPPRLCTLPRGLEDSEPGPVDPGHHVTHRSPTGSQAGNGWAVSRLDEGSPAVLKHGWPG